MSSDFMHEVITLSEELGDPTPHRDLKLSKAEIAKHKHLAKATDNVIDQCLFGIENIGNLLANAMSQEDAAENIEDGTVAAIGWHLEFLAQMAQTMEYKKHNASMMVEGDFKKWPKRSVN